MSLTESLAKSLFDIVAALGRPIGGVRPHRIAHLLSQLGYGKTAPSEGDFRWFADRHGLMMKLHPYYLIDREIIAFGAYELPLQRFIEKNIRAGMKCLDVGANMGAVALHLALRVGTSGQVYAFEPVPTNAERLREHAAKNGFEKCLQVVQMALSDTDGSLELLIAAVNHVNQGMGSLVETDHADLTNKIAIEAQRLDTFCDLNQINRIDFIKVDIQGAEPLFLAGAHEALRKMRPRIIMEVAPSSLSSGGYSSKDLLFEMEALGYHAFLVKNSGDRGDRLTASQCAPDFTAGNVLFEPESA